MLAKLTYHHEEIAFYACHDLKNASDQVKDLRHSHHLVLHVRDELHA